MDTVPTTAAAAVPTAGPECLGSPSGFHHPEVSNPNKCTFCGAAI